MTKNRDQAPKRENVMWKLLGPVVVLAGICLVVTTALAFANEATAPIIKAAEQAKADAAMQVVLSDGSDFQAVEGVDLPAAVTDARRAGNGAGYVFTVEAKGFGGAMSVMVGLDGDGKITGTQVITHAETQGIGSKVVEDGSPFQQQLVGMGDTSGIQATTGASVSSKAMSDAVQAAFDAFTVISGGTVEVKAAEKPVSLTDAVLDGYYPGASFTEVPGGMTAPEGTVVYAAAFGMESEVRVAVLFDADDQILGITVDAQDETAGLGTLCADPEFTDRFAGVSSADEVDAQSGATITSNAVKDAVNAAIANLKIIKGAA